MRIFIGLVPPPQLSAEVYSFAQTLETPWRPSRMEPHITIKAPMMIRPEEAERIVTPVAQANASFAINLVSADLFVNGESILILRADSAELRALHTEVVGAFNRFDAAFSSSYENDRYTPHLTVGKSRSPKNSEQLLTRAADRFKLPATFTVDSIILFGRPDNSYKRLAEIQLAG
jgi:2'-5' RNA ligase